MFSLDALPGIVDGARKTSHCGRSSRVRAGARGMTRGEWSSSAILETTISRNQCMSAVTSAVHHDVRSNSAVAKTGRGVCVCEREREREKGRGRD